MSRCWTNHWPSVNENFTTEWTRAISLATSRLHDRQRRKSSGGGGADGNEINAVCGRKLVIFSGSYLCHLPRLPPSPSFGPRSTPPLFFSARSTLARQIAARLLVKHAAIISDHGQFIHISRRKRCMVGAADISTCVSVSAVLCAVACVWSLISPSQSAFTQFAASSLLFGPAIRNIQGRI